MFLRPTALLVGLALLTACQRNDLQEPPVNLGDFGLGLNIVVADNVQKVPISRTATAEEWEASVTRAIDDRFGRYAGTKAYNIGISVDGYALAPPGIPVVAAPKSVLAVTANVWDDAAGQKLNAEGKQLIVFESFSGETVVGTGLTRSRQQQMDALSYNVAKAVETWLLENPEWFGLPPQSRAPDAPEPTSMSAPAAAEAPTAATPPVALPDGILPPPVVAADAPEIPPS